MVERFPTGDVERHPTTEEEQRCHAGNDEEVEVLGEVEETEVDTRILSVVSGSKLALGLGKVERATVGFGSTSNHIYYKCYDSGYMAFEDEPEIRLSLHDTAYRHSAGKTYYSDDRQTDREFVADHLRARTERTDECELIVTRPTCKENTEHADARDSNKEENTDIEVDDLQTVTPRKNGESQHGGENHQIGSECKQEAVDMVDWRRQVRNGIS